LRSCCPVGSKQIAKRSKFWGFRILKLQIIESLNFQGFRYSDVAEPTPNCKIAEVPPAPAGQKHDSGDAQAPVMEGSNKVLERITWLEEDNSNLRKQADTITKDDIS